MVDGERIEKYLPDQFEAERLYENMKKVSDFKKFVQYIEKYLESIAD